MTAPLRLVGPAAEPGGDPEEKARLWLAEVADDDILVCRGRGPRHAFDPLVPRRRKRGKNSQELASTWVLPLEGPRRRLEGYRLVQQCPDCLLVWRELIAGPDQVIPEPAKWRYWRDPRYSPPKDNPRYAGAGRISSAAARSEGSRRLKEDNVLARKAAEGLPAHVAEYVEAADLRAADYAVRMSRRVHEP